MTVSGDSQRTQGANTASSRRHHRSLFPFDGLRPFSKEQAATEVLAGCSLAALAIPASLGYATIAHMPVITGVYTMLLPAVAFALLGYSKHLVVGADSASAAILGAGLLPLAAPGSARFVAAAGMVALLVAVLLALARLIHLGFLADFLSRTVLVGFLTGVGITLVLGQVGGLLGIPASHGVELHGQFYGDAIGKFVGTVSHLDQASRATVVISVIALGVLIGCRRITRLIPAALIVVVGAIVASVVLDFGSHGVALVGPVSSGLPSLSFPTVPLHQMPALIGISLSIALVVLGQSAATSRAYAARYREDSDENRNLVGLSAANLFAGLTGSFAVNGSPSKTQMADEAGGRTQWTMVVAAVIAAVVLLVATGPLRHLPQAILAAVVLLTGASLIDLKGLRAIRRAQTSEFVIAVITLAAVVLWGTLQGIVVAVVVSMVNHIRHSYRPHTAVLIPNSPTPGQWSSVDHHPYARSAPGAVVLRFGSDLYYANVNVFAKTVLSFLDDGGPPLQWLCLHAGAISEFDYSASLVLGQLVERLDEHGVTFVFCEMTDDARDDLIRHGQGDVVAEWRHFEHVDDAFSAFHADPIGGDWMEIRPSDPSVEQVVVDPESVSGLPATVAEMVEMDEAPSTTNDVDAPSGSTYGVPRWPGGRGNSRRVSVHGEPAIGPGDGQDGVH